MIELYNRLKNLVGPDQVPLLNTKINDMIAYLIHLKYLCDTGKYKYDEVMSHKEVYPLTVDTNRLSHFIEREKIPINGLLIYIQYVDLKQLILEFLDSLDQPISFHNKDDKILYTRFNRNFYSYYNREGNATYALADALKDSYELFKIFDKVLGVQNQYISSKEKEKIKGFNYVYVYDDLPKYLLSKYNIYDDLAVYIQNNQNVVLYTNYNKISNFSDGKVISPYMKTVIIDRVKAIMIFHQDDDNNDISIINYDPTRITDLNKLHSILKNNRKQKDVLVKTTYQELKENNMRIGFHLYQLEKNHEIRDIYKIVDQNTDFLKELNRINEKVEREINQLLGR